MNSTTERSNKLDESADIMILVEKYTVPATCIFGIISNTISACVFLRKGLREYSSSLFLAARSISDNGFLVTLLTIWASSVYGLNLNSIRGLCHALIFFTYFFGCVSVWLVVFVTAENYIRICRPFIVSKVCNTRNAKVSVIGMITLVLSVYNFPFWTVSEQCILYKRYENFVHQMVYVDSVLTLVAPSTILAVLMSAIAMTTITSYRRRKKMRTSTLTRVKSPLTKVVTMLLAVTLAFLVLNLPYHIARLRIMIMGYIGKQNAATTWPLESTLQSISQLIYYFSLAINVVIYTVFSSKFRTTLKNVFLRKHTRHSNKHAPSYQLREAVHMLKKCSVEGINNNNELHAVQNEEIIPMGNFQSSNI